MLYNVIKLSNSDESLANVKNELMWVLVSCMLINTSIDSNINVISYLILINVIPNMLEDTVFL